MNGNYYEIFITETVNSFNYYCWKIIVQIIIKKSY